MKFRMKYMAIKMPGDTFAWMRAKFDDPPNANYFELEASRVCVDRIFYIIRIRMVFRDVDAITTVTALLTP